MKTIANIILVILAVAFVAICGITHYQVSQIWGTNNEIGLFVAFFGGIAVLGCAFNGAALLFHRDWRGFAAIVTFLILGWGSVTGSAWLFNNHDIVAHIELSALVFAFGLLFAPAMAAAVAGDK